jgi:signal transduction histidine kinase
MTDKVRKWLKQLLSSLELPAPEVAHRLARIKAIERNLVLPLKVVAIAIVFYSLHQSPWFGREQGMLDITVTTLNTIFAVYVAANVVVAAILLLLEYLPFALVQWSVFAMSLIDGIFVGALAVVSGGYDSLMFWLFIILIVRNVASNPPVWSQLVLNLCMAACFAIACFLAVTLNTQVSAELQREYGRPAPFMRSGPRVHGNTNTVTRQATNTVVPRPVTPPADPDPLEFAQLGGEGMTEAVVIRVIVLVLAGVWLYGVQVLLEKQKLAEDEAREFAMRENQLRSAGRLAAEFAHQIKNPLAIVNNAAFSLERGLKTGKGDPRQHLRIIQEEVRRADVIITQVMGYAELTEGRVEKLDLTTKIEQAVKQAFPPGLATGTKVEIDLHGPFPAMLMQRRHLAEILLNLLQNAREALGNKGRVTISARVRSDQATEIIVTDDGPGIAPDKLERVFEAYFTTKERGTGLGLSIVKNNTELYGGTVRAESELGKGARFILVFPAKASLKPGS